LITVRFLGGARKSFSADSMSLDRDELILKDLLLLIREQKPPGTPDLDIRNVLIAVNGADSSAMDGRNTLIRSGDTVSIIPVIHGGAHATFAIKRTNVAVFQIRGSRALDRGFLDSLRARHRRISIQAISSRFILNVSHVKKILEVSLESRRRGILLSERLETDILLRFAATTQISRAINDLGIRPGRDVAVLALGARSDLERITRELSPLTGSESPFGSGASHLRKYFGISKRELDSVSSETPLEDLLRERASVLF